MAGRLGLLSLSMWALLGLLSMLVNPKSEYYKRTNVEPASTLQSKPGTALCHFCHCLELKQSETVLFKGTGKEIPLLKVESDKSLWPSLINHKVMSSDRKHIKQAQPSSIFSPSHQLEENIT